MVWILRHRDHERLAGAAASGAVNPDNGAGYGLRDPAGIRDRKISRSDSADQLSATDLDVCNTGGVSGGTDSGAFSAAFSAESYDTGDRKFSEHILWRCDTSRVSGSQHGDDDIHISDRNAGISASAEILFGYGVVKWRNGTWKRRQSSV